LDQVRLHLDHNRKLNERVLGLDENRTALLTAIIEKRSPEPVDVGDLRRKSSLSADAPADELAWDVMRQALKKRGRASR
jgi:hypothetical protein